MKNSFFFARNILKSFDVPVIKPSCSANHLFFGLTSTLHRDCTRLLRQVEGSPAVTPSSWLLYRILGRKMIFLSKDANASPDDAVVSAVNIYYFNDLDAELGINAVHEAFIGVHKNWRGQGLATAIRQAAYEHFLRTTLSGITTRIKKDNHASLASAEKLGFAPIPYLQVYQKPENELYLIRPL